MLMFLSPPLRGAEPMALMLGHEWQQVIGVQPHIGFTGFPPSNVFIITWLYVGW
jgi:hypothetical protein